MGRHIGHAILFCELNACHSSSPIGTQFDGDFHAKFVFRLLARLIGLSCPAAVFWRIWTVVIDSIKRESGWPLSHVYQEILKRFPSFAHRDSSAAVPLPFVRRFVFAPLPHFLP